MTTKPKEKTIRIWARIGMSLDIPEQEYRKLQKKVYNNEQRNYDDFDLGTCGNEPWVKRFINDGFPDGESYIPASVFENNEGR